VLGLVELHVQNSLYDINSGVPRIFFSGEGERVCQEFVRGGGGSTNSVEDRGKRERRSGGGSPLVRGTTQFANERNPYSY
jgi:hypothetical protein